MTLFFVDCEAFGGCPRTGALTEFGAVEYKTKQSFYGVILKSKPSELNPAVPEPTGEIVEEPLSVFTRFNQWIGTFPKPHKFVSDNPAYDFQWINDGFFTTLGFNPFGHSARRIGDFYSGLKRDFYCKSDWKNLRKTPHTHHPVDDAMGNVEAFSKLLQMAKNG